MTRKEKKEGGEGREGERGGGGEEKESSDISACEKTGCVSVCYLPREKKTPLYSSGQFEPSLATENLPYSQCTRSPTQQTHTHVRTHKHTFPHTPIHHSIKIKDCCCHGGHAYWSDKEEQVRSVALLCLNRYTEAPDPRLCPCLSVLSWKSKLFFTHCAEIRGDSNT